MKNLVLFAVCFTALFFSCSDDYSEKHNHLNNEERIEICKDGFRFHARNVTDILGCYIYYDDPDIFDFSKDACCVSNIRIQVDAESVRNLMSGCSTGECFYCTDCRVFHIVFDEYDYFD